MADPARMAPRERNSLRVRFGMDSALGAGQRGQVVSPTHSGFFVHRHDFTAAARSLEGCGGLVIREPALPLQRLAHALLASVATSPGRHEVALRAHLRATDLHGHNLLLGHVRVAAASTSRPRHSVSLGGTAEAILTAAESLQRSTLRPRREGQPGGFVAATERGRPTG